MMTVTMPDGYTITRWIALQLPPEVRKDVPIPDSWEKIRKTI